MISDNNNHITYSADDIQRYWSGQLSPKEMHAMEKAALDDPFLADAMEGMGEALHEHDEKQVAAELNTLHEQLKARTAGKRGAAPVRSFRWWQVAAAALVVLVGGYWIFSSTSDSSSGFMSPEVAKNEPAATQQTSPAPALADSIATQKNVAGTDSTITMEIVGNDSEKSVSYFSAGKKPEPGFYKFETPEKKYRSDTVPLDLSAGWQGAVARERAALDSQVRLSRIMDRDAAAKTAALGSAKMDSVRPVVTEVVQLPGEVFAKNLERKQELDKDVKLQNIVKGIVTDNKNNPLANAFIRLDDKNGYVTDTRGNFKIPVSDSVVQVSVSLPGYTTQNFRLRTDNFDNAGRAAENQAQLQAQNQIQLQPNNAQLQEVVVSGYAKQRKASGAKDKGEYLPTALIQNANPTNGWLAYEEYIEKNKRVPADNPNLVGEVVLSFTVNKGGALADFKIEKSLSPQHDAEAQRLVREGPSWKLVRGRKSRVTVIVRF